MSIARIVPWLRGSLRQRLAVLLAVVLLPPVTLSVYLAWDAFDEHKRRVSLSVRQFALLAATYERKSFDDTRSALQRVAHELPLSRPGDNCAEVFAKALKNTPEFAGVGFYSPSGRRFCGNDMSLQNAATEPWFVDVQRFRTFTIGDYTFVPGASEPVVVAALAVYDDAGTFRGVLAASLRLYWLTAFLRQAQLPPQGAVFLLDSKGRVIAGSGLFMDNYDPSLPQVEVRSAQSEAEAIDRPDDEVSLLTEISQHGGGDFVAEGNDGVRRFYSSVALPHGDVTLLFGLPVSSALGWVEKDLITRLIGLLTIWITGVGTAWLGIQRLVMRWTSALRTMSLAYGRGDYSVTRNFERAPTELRELGNTLNLMAARIQSREEQLRESLAQKDLLLREIHHRVKNNLQIVASLLNIHGKSVTEVAAKSALDEVKMRVRALTLVHRYLYESDDLQLVDLGSFVSELGHAVAGSGGDGRTRISLETDIPNLAILSDRAVPIALLVTEAITNALKHAFPDQRRGRIRLRFEVDRAGTGVLRISDDGVGFEADASGESLGIHLMKAFAKQIGGELGIDGTAGTTVELRVPLSALTGKAAVTPFPAERHAEERETDARPVEERAARVDVAG